MWSYRCLGSGTVTKSSSCQHSDVAQNAIFLLFIVLPLSSRTEEGLWARDHELPRLVPVSFKCFGSPDSSGPPERWQGLRRAPQGPPFPPCVLRRSCRRRRFPSEVTGFAGKRPLLLPGVTKRSSEVCFKSGTIFLV